MQIFPVICFFCWFPYFCVENFNLLAEFGPCFLIVIQFLIGFHDFLSAAVENVGSMFSRRFFLPCIFCYEFEKNIGLLLRFLLTQISVNKGSGINISYCLWVSYLVSCVIFNLETLFFRYFVKCQVNCNHGKEYLGHVARSWSPPESLWCNKTGRSPHAPSKGESCSSCRRATHSDGSGWNHLFLNLFSMTDMKADIHLHSSLKMPTQIKN